MISRIDSVKPLRDFRLDINGLRAVAVLVVLLFHFHMPGVEGGFVGVDVFFVISGYLMTKIILSREGAGAFSFADFYWARFTRIVPALFVLVVVLLIFGWVFIDPFVYRAVGAESASALTFLSNIYLFNIGGYFSQSSDSVWLLHTWSLAVEWQFYILLPIILVFGLRLRLPATLILFAIAGASLLLSVAGPSMGGGRLQSFLFYMIPSRAWEMALGGFVVVASSWGRWPSIPKRYVEWIGLALILLAVLTFDSQIVWPGYAALVPAFGALLVIAANRGGATALRHPAFQYVGARSYSIYLWHWPIIVALRYFDAFTAVSATLGFLASFVLGELSFRLVEGPVRQFLDRRSWPSRIGVASLPVGACLAFAALVYSSNGYVGRTDEAHVPAVLDAMTLAGDWTYPSSCAFDKAPRTPCRAGPEGEAGSLVLGDSHAQMWFSAFERKAEETKQPFDMLTMAGCAPVKGLSKNGLPDCSPLNDYALSLATSGRYKTVYLIAHWREVFAESAVSPICIETGPACLSLADAETLRRAEQKLVKEVQAISAKAKVVIFLPTPSIDFFAPNYVARNAFYGWNYTDRLDLKQAEFEQSVSGISTLIKSLASENVTVLNPLGEICRDGECPLIRDDRLLLRDNNHLRSSFIRTLNVP